MSCTTTAIPSDLPACRDCEGRGRCLPGELAGDALDRFEHSITCLPTMRRHHVLYRRGDPLDTLYAVRRGQLKAERTAPDGRPQVVGFYVPGQLLGLEALARQRHCCDAVALCESAVCAIPYPALNALMMQDGALLARFHRMLGAELARQQTSMLLLGNARAPQRLAAFLLDLAAGYDIDQAPVAAFELRMSRDDIASHLGLALESVSRQLSLFRAAGLLDVHNRRIELRDIAALQAVAAAPPGAS